MDLIGAEPDEILAVSAKEGTGIPELLEAVVARVPPPRGERRRAAPRADLRFLLRPLPRRDPQHPGGGRRGARGHGDRLRRAPGRRLPRGRGRLPPAGPASRPTSSRPGEVGYVVASLRERARRPRGRHDPRRRTTAPTELLPGYRDVKSMVFAGIYPTDSDQYEDLRDALEKLQLNDASPALRAGDVHRARLRLPLRLPRPAAHGDRAGAAGARVRPRPHHHGADRGVPRLPHRRRRCCCSRTRRNLPDPAEIDRIEEPYVKARIMAPAEYIGGDHEAGPGAARRLQGHDYLDTSAGGVRLRVPAGRDHARLLRQAQVAQPRLRLARLRDARTTASAIWSSSTC